MRASTSVIINKPVREVWDFIADLNNMDKWVVGVSDQRQTSEGEFGAGATFASNYTYRNRTFPMTNVVTAFEPPHTYGVKSTSGPFPYEGLVIMEAQGTATRMTNTLDAGSDSWATSVIFALFGLLIRPMMRRQLHKELVALKSLLEGH